MSVVDINIILLGESNVGKTSLLTRYTKNIFNDCFISTLGVEFDIKKIKMGGNDVTLHITDTSGQEKYKSITQSFLRNVDGVIFVFDVTCIESFEKIKDWLKDTKANINDFDYVLAGNKIDLQDTKLINKEDIEKNDVLKDIKYFETSAKENINVEETFKELTDLILRRLHETGSISKYERSRRNSFKLDHSRNQSKGNFSQPCC